jgi:hypothetical protein
MARYCNTAGEVGEMAPMTLPLVVLTVGTKGPGTALTVELVKPMEAIPVRKKWERNMVLCSG